MNKQQSLMTSSINRQARLSYLRAYAATKNLTLEDLTAQLQTAPYTELLQHILQFAVSLPSSAKELRNELAIELSQVLCTGSSYVKPELPGI